MDMTPIHTLCASFVLSVAAITSGCGEDPGDDVVGTTMVDDGTSDGTAGETEGLDASDDTGSGSVCGNGIVEAAEQCDEGPSGGSRCNARCYIPGEVMWEWNSDEKVHDVAVAGQNVVVCGTSSAHLLDPTTMETQRLDGPDGECRRVVVRDGTLVGMFVNDDSVFFDRAVLRAYDEAGVTQWTTPWMDVEESVFLRPGVALGPEGEVVVAGATRTGIFDDAKVMRLDASGTRSWEHVYREADSSTVGAVAVSPGGQIIVGGYQSPPAVGTAMLLQILDRDANTLFVTSHNLTDDGVDSIEDMVLTPDGRVIATGSRGGQPWAWGFAPPATSAVWSTGLTGEGSIDRSAIASHPTGALIVALARNYEYLIYALDTEGQPLWSTTLDGAFASSDASLVIDAQGDLTMSFSRHAVVRVASPPI